MGKMQRDKGKVWEREVAAAFRALYGNGVKRGWQAREGYDAPDVDGTPFWLESKHHALVNIPAAVRQAISDRALAKDPRPIIAITKSNRAVPLATMPWTEFMQLLRAKEEALKEEAATQQKLTKMVVYAEQVEHQLEDLKNENAELDETLTGLSKLLTRIANTLLGEPPPDVLHDWSRLPELIRQARLGGQVVGEHPHTHWQSAETEMAARYAENWADNQDRQALEKETDGALGSAEMHSTEALMARRIAQAIRTRYGASGAPAGPAGTSSPDAGLPPPERPPGPVGGAVAQDRIDLGLGPEWRHTNPDPYDPD